jgi:hypothetical protein
MHKSINLWLLVFAIMTVGVSHEKQQPNENETKVNGAEIISENTLAVANEAIENISTMTKKESMPTTIGELHNVETLFGAMRGFSAPLKLHSCVRLSSSDALP